MASAGERMRETKSLCEGSVCKCCQLVMVESYVQKHFGIMFNRIYNRRFEGGKRSIDKFRFRFAVSQVQ